MSATWDVVVSGAGPAGSRAAELLAARGASVLLLDPRAPWEKPCGGGLTAAALRHTPELHELDAETQVVREILAAAPGGASVVVPGGHRRSAGNVRAPCARSGPGAVPHRRDRG